VLAAGGRPAEMLWRDLDPLPPMAALGRDTWPNTWLQLAHVNA
jgi:hypothetical protein